MATKLPYILILLAITTSLQAATISPNDFQGTDAERINQAIRVGAEKGLTVVVPKFNEKADSTTDLWLLDEAILVQENTILELNNCHLKLSDRCRDNFIRSANCGLGITDIQPMKNVRIRGVGSVLLEGANKPRSTGDSAKTLGRRTYGSDAGKEGVNQTGDWRNIGILLAYVENFTIENLTIKNSHCWAISLERCGFGRVHDVRFESRGYRMIDGKRERTLNQDGLDLRQGCHDISIARISGFTGDDLIALTNITLGGKGKWEEVGGADTTMVSGLSKRDGGVDDIRNITIRDVVGHANGHHVVRFLNAGGLKIYNVVLDGLIDNSPDNRPCKATVKIGDAHPGWGGVTPLGDTNRLMLSNISSNSQHTILIAGSLVDSCIANVIRHTKGGELITYASGRENVKNVAVTNAIQSEEPNQ